MKKPSESEFAKPADPAAAAEAAAETAPEAKPAKPVDEAMVRASTFPHLFCFSFFVGVRAFLNKILKCRESDFQDDV